MVQILDAGVLISDEQSAMDLFMSIQYETGCNHIIMKKNQIVEDFFDLKTKMAGGILQKCINYHIRLAVYGDYSKYKSKALKDFIYESNQGKDYFFVSSEGEAIEKLGSSI